MKKYQYVLFDFDGTIFNTSQGIFKSFDKVVEYYSLDVPDKSVYNTMVGPPLRESLSRVFKIPEKELTHAMEVYRKYYSASGMFEVQVYDGVIPLINSLHKEGKKVFVATSKPEIFAKQILERQNMLNLFDFVAGSDIEESSRVSKSDVIRFLLKEMNLEDKKDECVLIGDTHFDVAGAKAVGIDCIGILYGFGTKQELQSYGATYIEETPYDVQKLLCLH